MTVGLRVMIADDHRVFVDAIGALLSVEPDIVVVGKAYRTDEIRTGVQSLLPDVLLLDVELRDGDGIKLAHEVRQLSPRTAIVMLTAHADADTARAAVRAGAACFVPKESSPKQLVEAVRGVARGESWIGPRVLRSLLDHICDPESVVTPEQEKISRLTDRELAVFRRMIAGLNRAAIANELFISVNTVRTHTQNVLAKLEVHSSLEAVALGLRAGLAGDGLPKRLPPSPR